MRNKQAVIRSDNATRRPGQRYVRCGLSRGLGERALATTPIHLLGVRLHSMGLSVREVAALLGWLGVERSHGAVYNWTHKPVEQQEDLPTGFSHQLTEKHDGSEAGLFVDSCGYLTSLDRQKLSGQLN